MEKEKKEERVCPQCGKREKQWKQGVNMSGTERYKCQNCKKTYTPNPRPHAYDEETKKTALRMLVSGMSGRKIGLLLGMCKNNAYKWAQETSKKGPGQCG
jgi:transposase-like protein